MKTQTGFTLIEVLISMLILAVGLLGFAALQAASIKNNVAAYQHGQATQLLYDMSDRIRANVGAHPWDTATINVLGEYLVTTATSVTAGCSTTAGCTRTQLADSDLKVWQDAIKAVLPSGTGTITASPSNPITDASVLTLSITWDDDRSGAVDANDPTFRMELKP